jgi:hypothetical protein
MRRMGGRVRREWKLGAERGWSDGGDVKVEDVGSG